MPKKIILEVTKSTEGRLETGSINIGRRKIIHFNNTWDDNNALRTVEMKTKGDLKPNELLPFISSKFVEQIRNIETIQDSKSNHWYIKDVELIDPTVAACVPMSIENPAIAYDAVNDRFKVDIQAITVGTLQVDVTDEIARELGLVGLKAGTNNIGDVDVLTLPSVTLASQANPFSSNLPIDIKVFTASLPTGSNAIGKLAANSGVDIGDVDVLSMPNVAQATRTNLKTQPERIDLTFDSWDVALGAAGDSELLAAVSGQSHKIFAFGYESDADVQQGFRFGTSADKFGRRITKGVYAQTLMHPIIGTANTALNFRAEGAANVKVWVQYITEA